MRKTLGFLLLTLAIALPAWPQSTEQQNPIHTQTFDSALPRESFECSATQATLGTHMVNFLDTDGSVNGYVDCHGNIHGAGGGGCPAGADGTLQFNNGGACGGVLNSSVDPDTGGVSFLNGAFELVYDAGNDATTIILQTGNPPAGLGLSAATSDLLLGLGLDGTPTGSGVILEEGSATGINIDATGAVGFSGLGTGPINLTSAGGITTTDDSAAGITTLESAVGGMQNVFQKWLSPGTDTLANLSIDLGLLAGEGYQANCSDCDTPLTEGAVCTSAGDMAGALALYIRGALLCF